MDNTIIGHSAGKALLDGSHNTFLGAGAGEGTTTGANNTYLGSGAGRYLLTDSNNVHIGYDAGTGCITGSKNVLIGSRAGVDACGSNNIFIGYQAGENFSTSNSLIIHNSSSGIPLIYGEFDNQLVAVNGKLAVGHENPTHTVHVLDSTTAGGDGVGHFEFTGNGLVDAYGVSGRSVPADFFGYGGNFDGGYTGVRGRVLATGGSTYYGARGEVYGAVGGQSYGVYGSASGAGLVYAVYANGDMAYTGALINASDANLKTNVDIVPHGLEAVMQLLPRSYEYKSHEFDQLELPDGTHYGFLAQELEMIVPDLVKSSAIPTNHDKADADTQEFMKGVNYVELIPILTKAIQDQQVIIESLKQRISALEGQ